MIRLFRCIYALILTSLAVSSALAQVPTGTPQFGTFGGGPEVINLGNLNVHIPVPLLHKAGRGSDFTYDLSYDTSVWYPVPSGGTATWQFVPNWGWRAVTEVAIGYISYTATGPVSACNGQGQKTTYSNWTYHDPFGVAHWFGAGAVSTVTMGAASCQGTTAFTLGDGAGYTLSVNGLTVNSLTSRGGAKIQAPVNTGTGAGSFTDRNGNVLTANNSGQFFDTMSSTSPVLTVSGSGTPASPITYSYTAPSTGTASYTMSFKTYTVKTNFGCSGVADPGAMSYSLVDRITLPDTTFYQFGYEPTPGFAGDVTGRLASVTLPTGGTISYTYTGGSSGHITCSDGSASGITRQTPDGTWTYVRTSGAGAASTLTITDPERDALAPNGNQTVIQFQGIYETQRIVYQGSTSGALLRSWNTCYNGTASPCTGATITLPIARRTVIDQYGSGGVKCKHDYFYNTFGLLTEQDDYDYGATIPSTALRKEVIAYDTTLTNGIVSAPHTITVTDGPGNIASQTTYTYDQGTPTGTTSPQHVSITGSRGNPTTITSRVQGANTLSKTVSYFDTGNVQTATDVNGAATTYTYSNTNATCGNSFPTGVNEPLSLSKSYSWNCTGGVQTSTIDENAKQATIAYNDSQFWRPASSTDPANATTTLAYPGPTSVEVSLAVNSGSSAADVLQTTDGLGRKMLRQIRQAPGSASFDTISYSYNSSGELASASLPCAAVQGAGCSLPTATTYDALGRPLTVTDAGGGTTNYTYNQNDVLIAIGPAPTGENAKRRQLEYDSIGRLKSVCEISAGTGSGTCGQTASQTGFWTIYAYSTTASSTSVTTVTQNAQAGAGNQQIRTFTADAIGRLISEVNPENGTTIYTYDSASTCPAPNSSSGDLAKLTDNAGNTTCYSYDALHRVTSKTYTGPNASNTPNKYFVYDSATVNGVSMTNSKTRLAEAYTATSQAGTKITDVGFSYSARGEISDEYQSSPNSAGYYHENLQYWENGVTKQISGLPYLPTFTYAVDGEGRLTSISASVGQNPLTGVVYNAASLPTTVNLGSADSDTFNYDPNTLRMTKYQFNINGQSFSGTPAWNANGTLGSLGISDPFNVPNNQICTYSHDDLVRIASVNCGTATWQQNFSYDAFGNLNKAVPTGGTGISFQPTYSAATNRMTNVAGFVPSYDGNGNVLADPSNTYTWDVEGRPASINATSNIVDALGRSIDSGFQTASFYSPDGTLRLAFKGQLARRARFFLPGGTQAIFDVCGGGLIEYDHADYLGSPRLGSSPGRSFLWSMAYAPFGELYARSNTTAAGAFAGMFPDSFDLYNTPAREYSDQGRWASPDPSGLAAVDPSNPQSWNGYAYVLNNPASLVDPSGMGPHHPIPSRNFGFGSPSSCQQGGGIQSIGFGNCLDGGTGCLLDGFAANCGVVSGLIGSGATNVGNGTYQTYLSGGCVTSDAGQNCFQSQWMFINLGSSGNDSGGLDPAQFSTTILGAYKNAIKGVVLNKVCGQSRPSRAFKSVRNGAIVGATNGAYTGFISGEVFGGEVTLGVSGLGGAVVGGFIGGAFGATRALFTGVVLAEACDVVGAYD